MIAGIVCETRGKTKRRSRGEVAKSEHRTAWEGEESEKKKGRREEERGRERGRRVGRPAGAGFEKKKVYSRLLLLKRNRFGSFRFKIFKIYTSVKFRARERTPQLASSSGCLINTLLFVLYSIIMYNCPFLPACQDNDK